MHSMFTVEQVPNVCVSMMVNRDPQKHLQCAIGLAGGNTKKRRNKKADWGKKSILH